MYSNYNIQVVFRPFVSSADLSTPHLILTSVVRVYWLLLLFAKCYIWYSDTLLTMSDNHII